MKRDTDNLIELYDLLPTYPSIYDPVFNKKIAAKKEFRELAKSDLMRNPDQYLFNHQEIIKRFFADETPYNETILFHEVGVGKCVMPDTEVFVNGRYIKIQDIWNEYKSDNIEFDGTGDWSKPSEDLYVSSIDKKMKLVTGVVSSIYRQKINENVRLIELQNGSTIEITQAHHLLTDKGWTNDFSDVEFLCIPKYLRAELIDEDLVSLFAWQITEGHETRKELTIYQKDATILEGLLNNITSLAKTYNLEINEPKIRYPNEGRNLVSNDLHVSGYPRVPYLHLCSKQYVNFIEDLGYQWGNRSANKSIPDFIMFSNRQNKAIFLRSFFDAEASVSNQKCSIEISTTSSVIAKQIITLLKTFSIFTTLDETTNKATNGKNIKRDYYRITLSSIGTIKFKDSIGFGIDYKIKILNEMCQSKVNTNLKVYPVIEDAKAKDILVDINSEVQFVIGDVCKTKIKSVTEREYKGYVYDLEIQDHHNYVANNIICHNTCAAIAVCEMNMGHVTKRLKQKYLEDLKNGASYDIVEYDSSEKINDHRALIIVKGDTIKNNFMRDLEQTCAKGFYSINTSKRSGSYSKRSIDANKTSKEFAKGKDKIYTDQGKRIASSRKINESYEIKNAEAFSKELMGMSDKTIRKKYSGRVIVIDEAHTLRTFVETQTHFEDEDDDTVMSYTSKISYNEIWRLLHLVRNCKKLLLTATPMVDNVQEIASIMNLILDESEAIDPNLVIDKKDEKLIEYLEPKFRGRVSYVRQSESIAKRIDMGKSIKFELSDKFIRTEMKIRKDEMSDFQYNVYDNANEQSGNKNNPFNSRKRNASNFVFPDRTFGREGYNKNIIEPDSQGSSKNKYNINNDPNIGNKISKNKLRFTDSTLITTLKDNDNLRQLSCKFASIINEIKGSTDECCFCYTSLVRGSGANILSLCFAAQGFEPFIGQTSEIPNQRRRFALITNFTTEKMINNILAAFNAPKNSEGKYLKVVIGSPKSGEGLSFKHVRQVHIIEPFWHNSATYQAIGRAFRADSHAAFNKEGKYVKVYRHAAVYKNKITIDLEMYYRSELKDREIKTVERIMKRCAFDCSMNKHRNIRTIDLDGSVEADYQNAEYTCIGCDIDINDNILKNIPEDLSTYHLYYADGLFQEIQTRITDIFSKWFKISLNNLFEKLSEYDYNKQTILLCLAKMIREQVQVRDRYGTLQYIKEKQNMLYLQNTVRYNDQFLTEYTTNRIIDNSMTFVEYTHLIDIETAKQFIDETVYNGVHTYTFQEFSELFKTLNLEVKVYLLETSLIDEDYIDSKRRDWILKLLDNSIFIFNKRKAIIHMLYQIIFDRVHYGVNVSELKQKGRLRIYSLNDKIPKWRFVTEEEDKFYIFRINKIIAAKEQEISKKYSIYGIFNSADSEFRLRDKVKEAKMKRKKKNGEDDDRTGYPGSICENINKTVLIQYMEQFGIQPPESERSADLGEEKSLHIIPTRDSMITRLKRDTIKLDFTHISKQKLQFYYKWNLYSRSVICKALYDYFQQNNRLLVK